MKQYKICILCNFGPFPDPDRGGSVGGSEMVIAAIAQKLSQSPYNYEIEIYAHNYKKVSEFNGIKLFPCTRGDSFVSRIAHNDHTLVYSDSSWSFDTLLRNIGKMPQKVSLCLVGAYHLQTNPQSLKLLKENIDKFNLITHSEITPDYKWCIDNNLPVKVIPNGVDLSEFEENSIDFRQKYNIKEKYVILNISNYFFGKGQEILPEIAKRLSYAVPESVKKKLGKEFDYKDFIILSISNTVQYPYDKVFLERTKKQSKGENIRFLRDIPREDVVAAFKASDIFIFTSRKEVSPLVILESQASKTPWVSFDVGDVRGRAGGSVVRNFSGKDNKGYNIIDKNTIDRFCIHVAEMLSDEDKLKKVVKEGQKDIELIDWNNIVPLYDKIFKK
jgi:glycosyltransferase involved in cell wall biosynthesis